MHERFSVDLGGIVSLLSTNLYSGPQVYLRELIQNGLDAITASGRPGTLTITTDGTSLTITDTGTGLTADEAREFLATIGRSSKRDDLFGESPRTFLGQFGIGLLASFLIADDVVVTSCTDGGTPIRWVGHSDGTFTVTPADTHPTGTTVTLTPRPDTDHWIDPVTVRELATDFAGLADTPIIVNGELITRGTGSGRGLDSVWDAEFCEHHFGFHPLATIPLNCPVTGTEGVAFVLPHPVANTNTGHRVYAKKLLVSATENTILPDWAFFVRAVINTEALALTASREQLRHDPSLLVTQEEFGNQLARWIHDLLTDRPHSDLGRAFLETHHLALRALALENTSILRLVADSVPFMTTNGPATIAELQQRCSTVLYTTTTEEFHAVRAVARAQGLTIINGGYVYDADLLAALARETGSGLRQFRADDLTMGMSTLPADRRAAISSSLSTLATILDQWQVGVDVRTFHPDTTPAILITDATVLSETIWQQEKERADELWASLLGNFGTDTGTGTGSGTASYPTTLILNDLNDVAQALLESPDPDVAETLYFTALAASGEPLNDHQTEHMFRALGALALKALNQ